MWPPLPRIELRLATGLLFRQSRSEPRLREEGPFFFLVLEWLLWLWVGQFGRINPLVDGRETLEASKFRVGRIVSRKLLTLE
jgi:hypothetical protein